MNFFLLALYYLLPACADLPSIPTGGELSAYITDYVERARGEFWAVDSSETRFDSLGALWQAKLGRDYPDEDWGDKTHDWWSHREPNLIGVVGESMGSDTAEGEVEFSRGLLRRFLVPSSPNRPVRCLSVGSGIGREAIGALIPWCSSVDLIEPQAHLMEEAVRTFPAGYLGNTFIERAQHHAFDPKEKYDVVWIQWCTNYIPDAGMAQFVRNAAASLSPGGVIVLKDNVSAFADGVYNDENHMLIRSMEYLKSLVFLGNPKLQVLTDEPQVPWPSNLFPMRAVVFSLDSRVEERDL